LPDAKIKLAILHPDAEVPLAAVDYFAAAYSNDPTLMPLVIESVGKHGGSNAFRLLRRAECLKQSPPSIDWLMGELAHEYDVTDIAQDNYRFASALLLCQADPKLLVARHRQIVALPMFPEALRGPLRERMKMEFADWPSLWATFLTFGREMLERDEFTMADLRRSNRICEALARHPKEGGDTVLSLLQRNYEGYDELLMQWLEHWIVQLAGRMRLVEAIPLILERIEGDDDAVLDEITAALVRIGSDTVVHAVIQKWESANTYSKYILAETLEHIHTDAALGHLLRSLSDEDDFELELFIASSALGHFSPAAIEPARQLLFGFDEAEMDGDQWDLRYHLIAATTLMEERFPEYDAWHEEAVATHYGWTKLKKTPPKRLVDVFDEIIALNQTQPTTTFQLKITLKDIKPPIWRRVLVPDCTLDDLHHIIQIAMGWENYHLYSFKIDHAELIDPDLDEGKLNMDDATDTMLSDVIAEAKQKFIYTYDFGDDWRHVIVVEKIGQPEPGQKLPLCLKGSRACPPEDVGGPWGYVEYLAAMADPSHDRHQEFGSSGFRVGRYPDSTRLGFAGGFSQA